MKSISIAYRILTIVAAIDDNYTATKAKILTNYLSRNNMKDVNLEAETQKILELDIDELFSTAIRFAIHYEETATIDHKIDFLATAKEIILADGIIHPQEEELYSELTRILKVTNEALLTT